MNEQIMYADALLAYIGPPTEVDAPVKDIPALKPARKKPVTTIALTVDTCRWPFGDPATSDFHYCGELPLIGRPYCDMHDTQSYQAARKKKTAA